MEGFGFLLDGNHSRDGVSMSGLGFGAFLSFFWGGRVYVDLALVRASHLTSCLGGQSPYPLCGWMDEGGGDRLLCNHAGRLGWLSLEGSWRLTLALEKYFGSWDVGWPRAIM